MLLLLTHEQQWLVTNDPLLPVSPLLDYHCDCIYTLFVIDNKQTFPAAKKPRSVQGSLPKLWLCFV